jgi:acetyl esterase/lipase
VASLQAHLAAFVIRRQIRRRLGRMDDLGQVKAVFEGAKLPAPSGVRFRPDTLGGVPGEWAESESAATSTLLYLHGGGFIACSPRTHRPITGWFAKHGFRVFAPDYRLAPEHPFPAAVEDAVASWRALREAVDGPAVVAGDSAGGNLSLAMMLALRDAGDARPAAAALFSPATDLAGTGESYQTNARRDAMFPGEDLKHLGQAYLGSTDPRTPLASPLYADLAGLPPLVIHVGEREVLRDDSVRLAERARAAGVHVDLVVWPVVPHVWQLAHATVPEARRSLQAAAAFLHRAADASGSAARV